MQEFLQHVQHQEYLELTDSIPHWKEKEAPVREKESSKISNILKELKSRPEEIKKEVEEGANLPWIKLKKERDAREEEEKRKNQSVSSKNETGPNLGDIYLPPERSKPDPQEVLKQFKSFADCNEEILNTLQAISEFYQQEYTLSDAYPYRFIVSLKKSNQICPKRKKHSLKTVTFNKPSQHD